MVSFLFLYIFAERTIGYNETWKFMRRTLLSILAIAMFALSIPSVAMANEGNIEWADLDVADINLNYAGGVMHITGASGQVVRIYNVAGVTIKTFRIEGNDKRVNVPLADGIYIVKVGNSFTRKICVKH